MVVFVFLSFSKRSLNWIDEDMMTETAMVQREKWHVDDVRRLST
jgi:hypothetical protein